MRRAFDRRPAGRGLRPALVQRRDGREPARGPRGSAPPSRRPARRLKAHGRPDGPFRLPLGGFTYCLTLSSKCFSTFPHGTCSLSDSCQYLALDGVYHPLRAAFSSNPTPETARPVGVALAKALHLPWVTSFKRTSVLASPASSRPLPHSSRQRSAERFRAGLIPLHSPLVGESWLVSFPPLS